VLTRSIVVVLTCFLLLAGLASAASGSQPEDVRVDPEPSTLGLERTTVASECDDVVWTGVHGAPPMGQNGW